MLSFPFGSFAFHVIIVSPSGKSAGAFLVIAAPNISTAVASPILTIVL
jgi:hypothetical protein